MEIWMSIIGISLGLSSLPQILLLFRSKSSKDLSLLTYVILLHSQIWFLIYGLYKNSLSLILTNSICAGLSIVILYLGLKYRGAWSKLCMNIKLRLFRWLTATPMIF